MQEFNSISQNRQNIFFIVLRQIKKTDESLSFLFGEYYQERFEAAKKGSGGAFLSGDRRIFQSITLI